MPIRIFFIALVTFFYCFFINTDSVYAKSGAAPEFIPILKVPCYIGCDYSFKYCYNYNITNKNNGIKILEWDQSGDHIKGKASANLLANLIVKVCYQVSLTSSLDVINKELNLDSGFDFDIKINNSGKTSKDIIKHILIGDSTVSFSSFTLKGSMKEDPLPLMEEHLIDYIKYSIEQAVFSTVYKAVNGLAAGDNLKNVNIFGDYTPDDTDSDDSACPCY